MIFSLILSTINRKTEFEQFIKSLVKQNFPHSQFELIIIDKNDPKIIDLSLIVQKYRNKINIKHYYSSFISLSVSRNIGLRKARGQFVAFPDDDCIYSTNTLKNVLNNLKNNNADVVSGIIYSQADHITPLLTQVQKTETWLNNYNMISNNIMSAAFFVRRNKLGREVFDINFGVPGGKHTRYGSAEETDFLFRLFQKGLTFYFSPDIKIYHPISTSKTRSLTAYRYGIGVGALYAKHLLKTKEGWFFLSWLKLLTRAVGGVLLSFIKLQFRDCYIYLASFLGRLYGFFKYLVLK